MVAVRALKAKVILVETRYGENLGLSARACKNFGFQDLWLVKPKARKTGAKAKSRAMHGADLLKNAREFFSLQEALSLVDFSVGTTSKTKGSRKIFRNALSLREFTERFGSSEKTFGIVFGPEASGLRNRDLMQCDFIVHIPSHQSYKSLNLSHSVAIFLYEVFTWKGKKVEKGEMNANQKRLLLKEFREMAKEAKGLANRGAAESAVKAFVLRNRLSKKEANALLSLLKRRKK